MYIYSYYLKRTPFRIAAERPYKVRIQILRHNSGLFQFFFFEIFFFVDSAAQPEASLFSIGYWIILFSDHSADSRIPRDY